LSRRAKAPGRLAFWMCAGVSVALHILVVGLLDSPPPRVAAGVPAPEQSLQARLLPAEPSPPAPQAPPLPRAAGTPSAARPVAERPPVMQPAERAPAPREVIATGPLAPMPMPMTGDTDGYLPRSLLSVAPALLSPVTIPQPPDGESEQLGARIGVLAIYIDEAGRVRDVQGQEPRLPPQLEDLVRQTFLAARYAPGQRDGRAVRSRIRIEVVFQGRAVAPP